MRNHPQTIKSCRTFADGSPLSLKPKVRKDVFADSKLDLPISGSVEDALFYPTDVLVDYTKADVVKANVMTAIRKGVHVVVGSSGLTDEDFAEIN